MFTDEWGGGTSARCRVTDQPQWGADALFDIVERADGVQASYYKMPAVQTSAENCVAHNSSVIPVPNRDIYVQAWYQGGVSVVDFTDTANPVEIAFFDRGPITTPANPTGLNLGGLWATYWYNGFIYGTEIARGFDTFGLVPSDQLSANEIEAASEVQLDQFNSQLISELVAAPSFAVVRANLDQVVRADGHRCQDRRQGPAGRRQSREAGRSRRGRVGAGSAEQRRRDGSTDSAGQASVETSIWMPLIGESELSPAQRPCSASRAARIFCTSDDGNGFSGAK